MDVLYGKPAVAQKDSSLPTDLSLITSSPVRAYSFAIAASAAALLLRALLDPVVGPYAPFGTVFLAVMAVAWLFDWRPAALSFLLGVAGTFYLFYFPVSPLRMTENAQTTGLIGYTLACAAVIGMGEAYRRRHQETGLALAESHREGKRLQAEIAALAHLEEASNRLAAIIESSEDAIVSKNLNGIVISWNASAERIFGYAASEMVGKPITALIPPELHGDEQRILRALARGERIEHYETVRVTKDGSLIDVSLTISPVKDGTGRIVGASKIARDITQQKKAEQALRTAERLASVGRLAATVAHEINNPLEAVTNLVYLARTNSAPQEVAAYLAAAEEELERVSQLTRQTLGFYRDTRAAASVDLNSLLPPLLSMFASKARNKAIEIRSEVRQVPDITAIAGEIRQLIANLLGNSIDAVDGPGLIRIRLSPASERNPQLRSGVRLTVADSGPGVPASIRPNLFQPFFTTKKEVGTGLGLWVCKSIVDQHGGTIRLRSSVTPGRSWTVFSVFLPEVCQPLIPEQESFWRSA